MYLVAWGNSWYSPIGLPIQDLALNVINFLDLNMTELFHLSEPLNNFPINLDTLPIIIPLGLFLHELIEFILVHFEFLQ